MFSAFELLKVPPIDPADGGQIGSGHAGALAQLPSVTANALARGFVLDMIGLSTPITGLPIQYFCAVGTGSTDKPAAGRLGSMGYEIVTVYCAKCGHARHLPPEQYTEPRRFVCRVAVRRRMRCGRFGLRARHLRTSSR